MFDLIKQFDGWLHSKQCKIIDKTGTLVPFIPNQAQKMILKAMYLQAKEGKPIRVVVGKSRQLGSTSVCMAFLAFCAMIQKNRNAFSLSHRMDELKVKFREVPSKIMKERGVALVRSNVTELILQNGSSYRIGASKSDFVLSGNTCHLLHIMEGSKFEGEQGEENIISVLNSVPNEPNTCIIFESTAYGGRDPIHFEKLHAAMTEKDYPYSGVFLPWFIASDYKLPTAPLIRTDYERKTAIIAREYDIDLSDDQLAYRRNKVMESGESFTKREYPCSYLEAVEAAEGLIYPGMDLCLIDRLPEGSEEWLSTDRYGGYDAGTEDPCSIISGYFVREHLYIYDVCSGKNMDLMEQASVLEAGCTYYADPSSKREISELNIELRKVQSNARLTKAPRRMVSGDTDFISEEIRLVQNMMRQGKLHILRSCSRSIIEEAGSFMVNKATGKPMTKRTDGHHFDNLASLRYLVMGIQRQHIGVGTLVQAKPRVAFERRYNRTTRTTKVRSFI